MEIQQVIRFQNFSINLMQYLFLMWKNFLGILVEPNNGENCGKTLFFVSEKRKFENLKL